jgi:hypothetical protein
MSVKMRARDSFYSDDTGQVAGNAAFEVGSAARADELVKRGLAVRVGDEQASSDQQQPAGEASPAKPARANKAARPAADKAARPRAAGRKPRAKRKT